MSQILTFQMTNAAMRCVKTTMYVSEKDNGHVFFKKEFIFLF